MEYEDLPIKGHNLNSCGLAGLQFIQFCFPQCNPGLLGETNKIMDKGLSEQVVLLALRSEQTGTASKQHNATNDQEPQCLLSAQELIPLQL